MHACADAYFNLLQLSQVYTYNRGKFLCNSHKRTKKWLKENICWIQFMETGDMTVLVSHCQVHDIVVLHPRSGTMQILSFKQWHLMYNCCRSTGFRASGLNQSQMSLFCLPLSLKDPIHSFAPTPKQLLRTLSLGYINNATKISLLSWCILLLFAFLITHHSLCIIAVTMILLPFNVERLMAWTIFPACHTVRGPQDLFLMKNQIGADNLACLGIQCCVHAPKSQLESLSYGRVP